MQSRHFTLSLIVAVISLGNTAQSAAQSVRIRPGASRSLTVKNVGQALQTVKPRPSSPQTTAKPSSTITIAHADTVAPIPETVEAPIDLSELNPYKLGDYTLSLPKCVTVSESGSDFILASCKDGIDVDAWILNDSYKIATPDAYVNHLKRSVTRIESSANRGALREITGYDAPTDRNFYVALIPDGGNFYVIRLRFKPSMAEEIYKKVIPNLISQ